MFGLGVYVLHLAFFFSFFFSFFFLARVCETCGYCLCTVQWTIVTKFDFSHSFQPTSAHYTLFTNPQTSLFNNFFIKNRFHGTIHTFKNYFTTVFFSFQLYPNRPIDFTINGSLSLSLNTLQIPLFKPAIPQYKSLTDNTIITAILQNL